MFKSIRNKITKDLIAQGFRYGLNCGFSFAFKIGLSSILFLFLREQIAYALVQIPLFFFSYYIHSKGTFKKPMSLYGVIDYFRVIVVFQLLDYLIFSIAFTYLQIQSTVSVLIATIAIFAVRFFWVRKSILGKT